MDDKSNVFALAQFDGQLGPEHTTTLERMLGFLLDHGVTPDEQQTIRVIHLAADKCLMESVARHPSGRFNRAETRRAHRLNAFRQLWLQGTWREPWLSLIDQEFPGAALTVGDTEGFTESSSNATVLPLPFSPTLRQLRGEMIATLKGEGYDVDPYTVLLIELLLLRIPRFRGRFPRGEKDFRAQLEVSLLIHRGSAFPDHPAWVKLLEKYFSP